MLPGLSCLGINWYPGVGYGLINAVAICLYCRCAYSVNVNVVYNIIVVAQVVLQVKESSVNVGSTCVHCYSTVNPHLSGPQLSRILGYPALISAHSI